MAEKKSFLREFQERVFGFAIKREPSTPETVISFAPRETDDGALVVSAGGTFGTYLDLEGSAKTEAELVARYREMSIQPEAEQAIEDIVSEAIVKEGKEKIVDLNLDDVNVPDPIKDIIMQEWDIVSKLLEINTAGYEIFKRWYVDGRMYYHVIIDKANIRAGIVELRYIDPRKLRKVRIVRKERRDGVWITVTEAEYFMYNERGFKGASVTGLDNQGMKIARDSIIQITSGIVDKDNKLVLGSLHKAIKPLNQLRIMEDATVIYRISRAPERRVFNIDVGQMPKTKAEQFVRDQMVKHKNRLIYDATTGDIRDDRKFMTMIEDYWFPKRDGKGTTVDTLEAGKNLGVMEDVRYFEEKLYRSLNVPVSHLLPETGFTLGRSSQITRDELKFQKYILRLRLRFSQLFMDCLEKQLVLKGVLTSRDWDAIKNDVHFDFRKDNFFTELKNEEILRERVVTLQGIEPYIGRFFSMQWTMKNVLQMSDQDIKQMQEEILEEGPLMQKMAIGQDPQLAADVEQTQAETKQITSGGPKKPPAKKKTAAPAKKSPPTKEGTRDKNAGMDDG